MSYSSTWYLVLAGMIHILDEVTSKPWYARSKHPTQLAKVSFDEILDLTAGVFFLPPEQFIICTTSYFTLEMRHHTLWGGFPSRFSPEQGGDTGTHDEDGVFGKISSRSFHRRIARRLFALEHLSSRVEKLTSQKGPGIRKLRSSGSLTLLRGGPLNNG